MHDGEWQGKSSQARSSGKAGLRFELPEMCELHVVHDYSFYVCNLLESSFDTTNDRHSNAHHSTPLCISDFTLPGLTPADGRTFPISIATFFLLSLGAHA